jgi:hypothetical protein
MGSDAGRSLASASPRFPKYASPGDAPRKIGLPTFYRLLPGNLQIMVIAFPPAAVGVSIWALLDPRKESLSSAFTALIMLPIYVLMIESHRRRLNNYHPAVGIITKVERGEKEFSGCWVLHYAYVVDARDYNDDHMTANTIHPQPGELVWILVHPTKPRKSVLWIESYQRL